MKIYLSNGRHTEVFERDPKTMELMIVGDNDQRMFIAAEGDRIVFRCSNDEGVNWREWQTIPLLDPTDETWYSACVEMLSACGIDPERKRTPAAARRAGCRCINGLVKGA